MNNLTYWIKKNSSTILTVISAVGVAATGIAVAKETPKVLKAIEKAEYEKGEKLDKVETVAIAAKNYIPAIGIATGTVLCIFGVNYLNKKKQVELISAYNLLLNYGKNYRQALINMSKEDIEGKSGYEVDKEIRMDIARGRCDYHCTDIDIPDQKVIWVEPNTGRRIEAYERVIMDAEYHFNRNFTIRGSASLNELLMFLGFSRDNEELDETGWDIENGYYWVDFEHIKIGEEDGVPVYEVSTIFPPDKL